MKKVHYSVLRVSLISIILGATCAMTQQKLPEFTVYDLITLDLSAKTERGMDRRDELGNRVKLTVYERSELDSLYNLYPETVSSIWDVDGDGCSWYCGGGNYLVTASSSLKSNISINYNPEAANDLSYKTAWVEGKEDEGIGEYIEYTFENESPRITSIIISNGYVKILNLLDTKNNQLFQLGTFGHNTDGSDLVLKFEIAEVYKGLKYNDTAITEIYFDGIDVH